MEEIPARLRGTIRHFTTDMWDGYIFAVEEYIAEQEDVAASLVIDRFHVAQQYREGFDALRKKELKRLKKELPEETYKQDCKHTLWPLRKNHNALQEDERMRLRRLFRHSPELHQAYTFREELTAIFNQSLTPEEADRRLHAWVRKVQRHGLSCYDGFIRTLTRHWQRILNYFDARINSGFVEGFNNKIKVIKRRCYGIKKTTTLFQRLWLDLEGRHRFFMSTP